MANDNELVRELTDKKYEYGFTTDIHTEVIERGLNEDVIRLISAKKGEPEWLLDFRLKAFRYWQTLEQPDWGTSTCRKLTIRLYRTMPTLQRNKRTRATRRLTPN